MDAQQLASLFATHMQRAPTGHPAAGALDWQVRMNDLVALMIVNYGLLFEAEEEDHCSAKPATRKYGRFLRKVRAAAASPLPTPLVASRSHVASCEWRGLCHISLSIDDRPPQVNRRCGARVGRRQVARVVGRLGGQHTRVGRRGPALPATARLWPGIPRIRARRIV